ncbi:MAG: hypothetical protein KDG55_19735 [Rhodocyclaceae bacterium]|nr:hypothetical protein [Rhodocyclaceae bacterium]
MSDSGTAEAGLTSQPMSDRAAQSRSVKALRTPLPMVASSEVSCATPSTKESRPSAQWPSPPASGTLVSVLPVVAE